MYKYFIANVATAALNAGIGADNQRKTAMVGDSISKHGCSSTSHNSRGNLFLGGI